MIQKFFNLIFWVHSNFPLQRFKFILNLTYSSIIYKPIGMQDPSLLSAYKTKSPINCLDFTPSMNSLIYGCQDGSIVVNFLNSKQQGFKILNEIPVTALRVSKDGKEILSGLKNGLVAYWTNRIESIWVQFRHMQDHQGPQWHNQEHRLFALRWINANGLRRQKS